MSTMGEGRLGVLKGLGWVVVKRLNKENPTATL